MRILPRIFLLTKKELKRPMRFFIPNDLTG